MMIELVTGYSGNPVVSKEPTDTLLTPHDMAIWSTYTAMI
jgi:hypothetical protein